MPTLQKIIIRDFRNIALQELSFSPNVNCICGGNGEGKTNLLDAIWYLSMTKSAFTGGERFNFRHGCESFEIGGWYAMEGGISARFSVKSSASGEKVFKRDDKAYDRISRHIGVLPVVLVSPADIALVSESGDERRRFVNAVLSQMDAAYLDALQQYNRLLLQRNKLLKADVRDDALLQVFDEKMAALAQPVFERRERFAEGLLPVVSDFYSRISGGKEQVGVEYRSDLRKGPLTELMRTHRERDFISKYTTCGIQRDDFLFTMDGWPIRRCGSQGQQKSFLVALKFAQYELMRRESGSSPALLLDDLFDKLDTERVANLLSMVSGSGFGQIFITDTHRARLSPIIDALTGERAYFETAGGTFTRQDG